MGNSRRQKGHLTMLTNKQLQAYQKARRIHSPSEMVEIHTSKVYRWVGEFEPLNEITLLMLVNQLDKERF